MTTKTEQAFPTYLGMTLRDYFAAQAMIALASNKDWVVGMDKRAVETGLSFKEMLAHQSYDMADKLLEARDA